MSSAAEDRPLVTVTLSNCTARDARTVLAHLTARFPDRAPAQDSSGSSGTPPTVWTAELDVQAGTSASGPGAGNGEALEGPVSGTAQGAPHDVVTVREALARAFGFEDAGSVSGDQEQESQFRLAPR
ncbi:hypothetical protein ACIREE_03405 [Streptomyces sp. NPDC102467]|uniref:hypothetical protein n=1 Tax=Streptomyces sp. NPDC102467 TaxID=3366179 RepID=UPI0037F434D2